MNEAYINLMSEIAQQRARLSKYNNKLPRYAIMSRETSKSLKEKAMELLNQHPENVKVTVFGLKVLLDNELKTGEVEVR